MRISKNYLLAFISILTACNKKSSNVEYVPNSLSKNDFQYSEIIDLSHEFSEETIYWVTAKKFKLDTVFNIKTDKGFYYSAYNFTLAEHGGTYIDAPIHFLEISAFENLTNLDKLPNTEFYIVALPMKIKGCSGLFCA